MTGGVSTEAELQRSVWKTTVSRSVLKETGNLSNSYFLQNHSGCCREFTNFVKYGTAGFTGRICLKMGLRLIKCKQMFSYALLTSHVEFLDRKSKVLRLNPHCLRVRKCATMIWMSESKFLLLTEQKKSSVTVTWKL